MAAMVRHSLRELRGATIGWGLALLALAAMVMSIYPSIESSPELEELWESYPEAVRALSGGAESLTSIEGYLDSQFFAFVPIVLAIFAVGKGARAIAGEEEDGTMDLLLAQPVPRWKVVTAKLVALVGAVATVALVSWLGLAIGAALLSIDVSLWALLLACTNIVVLTVALASVALFGSALFRRRRHAVLVGTAVTLVSYFVNALAPLASWLEAPQRVSLFYFYSENKPLEPFSVLPFAVLLLVTLGFWGLAVWAFQRKQIAT